jgi:hypothetical protein
MTTTRHTILRLCFVGIIVYFIANFNFIRNQIQDFQYNFKHNKTSCNISMIESDQYLCETDEKWQKRREVYSKQHEKNILTMNEYEHYFSKNWFPEFQCQNEIRLGDGDGGKWVSIQD